MHIPTRPLSRRTLLRGLGGISVGLPFMEEMMRGSVLAAAPAPVIPVRAFNLFFGLGIPAPLQKEGFEGVLEPLKPLAKKLLIMRGIDHVRCDKAGINAHFDGSSAAFTAEPPNGTARAGGASIDQVIKATHYPKGLPPGMVPTLIAGTFFRRDRLSRYAKSFNKDGTAAASVQEQPRELFERVFGTLPHFDLSDPKARRVQRSVLDSVLEQYKHYTGARSPLGAASKARLAEHLDRIREHEQRAYAETTAPSRPTPANPGDSKLLHGGAADPGGEGIDITLEELVSEWRLMAGLYAIAIQTDAVRFGSLTYLAAGERIRLKGRYDYDGRTVFDFNDGKQRNKSGAGGCSHEWWHDFREDKKNEQLRAHAHMKLREIAHFMSLLDGKDSIEANGRTILDNTLFALTTESGDGRHNDVKRELSGVFHAMTGANGRFKTGQILDVNCEGLDVYNTILHTMGCTESLGPKDRKHQPADAIRA